MSLNSNAITCGIIPALLSSLESLLLGLPVPGIFLAKDDETQKLLVIDGSQRIRTLVMFYSEKLQLTKVQEQFENLTYSQLTPTDRRRLDNSILHATVVKQDKPSEDRSSIYFVFERLNKGAMILRPQEIRAAIYTGAFNDLLIELNKFPNWRSLFGTRTFDKRRRDQELILRFVALFFEANGYKRPMEAFLNQFMTNNRNLQKYNAEQITNLFETTINIIANCLGAKSVRFKRAINAAFFDSIAVAVARRLEKGDINNCEQLAAAHQELLINQRYIAAITGPTADEQVVMERLELATAAFANVE